MPLLCQRGHRLCDYVPEPLLWNSGGQCKKKESPSAILSAGICRLLQECHASCHFLRKDITQLRDDTRMKRTNLGHINVIIL